MWGSGLVSSITSYSNTSFPHCPENNDPAWLIVLADREQASEEPTPENLSFCIHNGSE
jgi:hypothetical protein